MFALMGCAGGDRQARVEVDTLESGAVLVRNGAVGAWRSGEAWRAVEEVRIGSAEAADPVVLFADVWDVTVDALGRIYVLDRQPKEVRVFAPSGQHVRTLGREGGGPGEFRNPIGLAWGPEGNLWVTDTGNARYEVFDTAGNYLDSRPRRIGGWGYPWGGGFDTSGRLYEPSYFSDPAIGASRRVYVRHSVAGDVLATDTFELPQYESMIQRIEVEGGLTIVGIPFAPQLTWRFDGGDGLWFSVNEAYRLYYRALAGDTVRIVERAYIPVPVTDADRSGVRDRFAEFGEPVTNEIIARIPEVKPAFESFVVDDRGYLWVVQTTATEQDISRGSVTFDVFDPEGYYLGPVYAEIGTRPPPRIIGDRLVGVVRDELGVPYVVLHRIEGR
jgi:hypothetical protein